MDRNILWWDKTCIVIQKEVNYGSLIPVEAYDTNVFLVYVKLISL